MKVQIETVIIAKETKLSKKTGNPYSTVLFTDGSTPVNAMYIGKIDEIETLVPCSVVVDVNLKYGDVKVSEWAKM